MSLTSKPNLSEHVKLSFFISCLPILLLVSTIVKSDLFILPWLAGYYSYVAIGIILTVTTGIIVFKLTAKRLKLPLPVVCFMAWVMYVILNGLLQDDINLRHISVLTAAGAFISCFLLLRYQLISIRLVFTGISSI